jgi:hypothetical protein
MNGITLRLEEVTTQQPAEWARAMDRCASHDFYHLAPYHVMAEQAGEGEARLFVYTEGEYAIALPLLLCPLDEVEQLGLAGTGWMDATSVYGFPGPVGSHRDIPAAVTANFQGALRQRLCDLRVVTAFSRLNPLLNQRQLLADGEVYPVGHTVAIDLTLPPDLQRSYFRRAFKRKISKLRRLGLTVVRDQDGSYFEDFFRIYHETMRRVGATRRLFFSRDYFHRLRAALGSCLDLFVCLLDGKPISAGLCIACHGILQFHLGGTLNRALQLAPMKLLVDELRLWGISQGLRVLHLGGGATTDPADTLLHFKKGFSDRTHEFAVWRSILFPDVYQRLCEQNAQWSERHQLEPVSDDFFPAYRCPTTCRVSPAPVLTDSEPILDSSRFSLRGTP